MQHAIRMQKPRPSIEPGFLTDIECGCLLKEPLFEGDRSTIMSSSHNRTVEEIHEFSTIGLRIDCTE